MAAQIEVQRAGDAVTSVSFGTVLSGETSSPITLTLKNVGDITADYVTVQLVQASTVDGEGKGNFGATPLTSSEVTVATELDPDDSVTVDVQFGFPADAPPIALDTCILRVRWS